MSITTKLLPLSMVSSLLLFTACGGGESNDSSQSEVSVPQKISIDIPTALKNERSAQDLNKLSFQKETQDVVKSYGYEQLQSTITQAEDTIDSVKTNMKYLKVMMPDIIKECEGTTLNKTCTIPEGVISLSVEGHSLSMGKINYTQQDKSNKHQQIVILDLKPTLISMGDSNIEKDLETVKWSNDEKHIETISDVRDGGDNFKMHLIYDVEENNTSHMSVTDKYSFDNMQGEFTIKLNDKNDINNTVTIETNSLSKLQNGKPDSFSSKGKVSNSGGYLISRGKYEEESYAEKETFDTSGSLLKSTFCYSGDNCNIDKPDTWINFDYNEGIIEGEFSDGEFIDDEFIDEDFNTTTIEYQEPLELSFTNSESFPAYTYCEILPLNYSDELTEEQVYMSSIGSYAKFDTDDDLFGVLFDISQKENINELPIACNTSEDASFHYIDETIKPVLSIKN